MTNEVAQPFRLIAALLVVATVLALPAPGFAQTSGGAIAGVVADAQGGVLPGVVVTAKNADSGVLRSTVTEPDGRYRVTALPPGRYLLSAELQGFATAEVRDVTLTIGLEVRQDLALGLQGVQEAVTVSARIPVVETTKSEVAAVVTAQQIDTLPVEGRSAITLSLLLPGTSTDAVRSQRPGAIGRPRRPLDRRHELHRRRHEQHDLARRRRPRGRAAVGHPGVQGHRLAVAGRVRRPGRRRRQRGDQGRRQPAARRSVRVLPRTRASTASISTRSRITTSWARRFPTSAATSSAAPSAAR